MEKQKIISELKKEHQEIMNLLLSTRKIINKEKVDFKKIKENLVKFEKKFSQHLEKEDKSFYPQLLDLEKKEKIDLKNTQEFIDKMKNIEKGVYDFLRTYPDKTSIKDNFLDFKKDLERIIYVIKLRIETEEGFVFVDYEMLIAGLYGS